MQAFCSFLCVFYTLSLLINFFILKIFCKEICSLKSQWICMPFNNTKQNKKRNLYTLNLKLIMYRTN